MPRIFGLRSSVCLGMFALTAQSLAGPECGEGPGDAGSGRGSAYTCSGTGSLAHISGSLAAARGFQGADFEDMYLIRIVDTNGFSARTDGLDGSFADFDTQLWLFRLDLFDSNAAFGLLGNDEIPDADAGPSRLLSMADDGTNQGIPGPGLYLIAISGFNNDPQSAGGAIFNQALRPEISGPDGPGGAQPHTGGWSGPGAVGQYIIALTGCELVSPVPLLGPQGTLVLGGLLMLSALMVFGRRSAA